MKVGQIVLILITAALLTSCTSNYMACKRISIEEARYWEQQGYETRIVIYQVALFKDTRWTHHAQAQIKTGDNWRWASRHQISDLPEADDIGNYIQYWPTDDYYRLLVEVGEYK